VERRTEDPRRHRRHGRLRRSWTQVSDLGTHAVPHAFIDGHFDGAGGARVSRRGAKSPRSTGMTTGGGSGQPDAAGGPARHIPVLVEQVVEYLNVRDGSLIIDGTFGAGGYTREILARANCRVIGIDRDQTAIAAGFDLVEAMAGRLTLVEDTFSALGEVTNEPVDGVTLDLGVSSMQLDTAERGFSFRLDGPLDMRMSGEGASAADVVNTAGER